VKHPAAVQKRPECWGAVLEYGPCFQLRFDLCILIGDNPTGRGVKHRHFHAISEYYEPPLHGSSLP
jgi:hypothetical protein